MEFRKTSVPSPEDPNVQVEGLDIPVAESVERWSEVHLVDGTVFRVKLNVISVVRLLDRYDEHGNPVYFINGHPAVAMVTLGESTKKAGSET